MTTRNPPACGETSDAAETDPQDFEHRPVMLGEVVAAFEPVPAGVVVDATVGGGGHSEAILEARPDVNVLGLDRDPGGSARRG